ncbi:MAG: DNA methyltransferase [Lawsonella clevelandensis]
MHPGRRKKLKTIWPASEVGSSDSAKTTVAQKFGDDIQFATPKPEPLLERIINAATEPGDYVWSMLRDQAPLAWSPIGWEALRHGGK